MTIAAVYAKLLRMDGMWKADWLDRLIPNARVGRREIIRDTHGGHSCHQRSPQQDLQRQLIGPFWKDVRHDQPTPKLHSRARFPRSQNRDRITARQSF